MNFYTQFIFNKSNLFFWKGRRIYLHLPSKIQLCTYYWKMTYAGCNLHTQSQNSSKIWINQLVLNRSKAFLKHLGLGFGKKNNKKDLPSLYKKSQKWVLNFSKIWKNLSSMFFIYLKMLTIFFHKSGVTKIALMEQVFSILYESKHQREASGSMASFNSP